MYETNLFSLSNTILRTRVNDYQNLRVNYLNSNSRIVESSIFFFVFSTDYYLFSFRINGRINFSNITFHLNNRNLRRTGSIKSIVTKFKAPTSSQIFCATRSLSKKSKLQNFSFRINRINTSILSSAVDLNTMSVEHQSSIKLIVAKFKVNIGKILRNSLVKKNKKITQLQKASASWNWFLHSVKQLFIS